MSWATIIYASGSTVWKLICRVAWTVPLLCIPFYAAAGEADDLVEQLKIDDFEIRRAAVEKLIELGEAARPALEKAAASDNLKLRATVAQIMGSMKAMAQLVLHVFDRKGNRIEGVVVYLSGESNQIIETKPSDAQGRIVTEVAVGRASYTPYPQDKHLIGTSPSWGPEIRPGENINQIVVSHGGSIGGRVLDANGAPVNGARVLLIWNRSIPTAQINFLISDPEDSEHAITDDEGRWTKADLFDGVYQIIVLNKGYAGATPGIFRVRPQETTLVPDVRLVEKKMGSFSCKLLSPKGTPLANTPVGISIAPFINIEGSVHEISSSGKNIDDMVTDNDGQLTIEDLAPQTSSVQITSREDLSNDWGKAKEFIDFKLRIEKVVINSGAAADVGSIRVPEHGSVGGVLTLPRGTAHDRIYVAAIPEELVDVEGDAGLGLVRSRLAKDHSERVDATENRVSVSKQGTFEFSKLRAGRYALLFYGPVLPPTFVFGIKVAAGARTAVPPIAIPEEKIQIPRERIDFTIRQTDGTPVRDAEIFVRGAKFNHHRENTGIFDMSGWQALISGRLAPLTMSVSAPGMVSQDIDLTYPGIDFSALNIILKKALYGAAKLKVVDPSGKPLQGACIIFNEQTKEIRALTDRTGIALAEGLATGKRKVIVELDGYYQAEDLSIAISPDTRSEAQIVLRPCLTLRGTVTVPNGYPLDHVLVWTTGGRGRRVRPAADGSFVLPNNPVGETELHACAPGLCFPTTNLRIDEGKDPSISVVGQESGTIIASVDPKLAGRKVQLSPAKHLGPPLVYETQKTEYVSLVDNEGRIEFMDVGPDSYTLIIQPNEFGDTTLISNDTPRPGRRKVAVAELKAGSFTPVSIAPKDLAKSQPIPVSFKEGTGAVTGRVLRSWKPTNSPRVEGELVLSIVSRDAQGTVRFEYPYDLISTSGAFIIGKVPETVHRNVHGAFDICGLPSGEFELYASLTLKDSKTDAVKEILKPTRLMTFTLKDGENKDLGELDFMKDVVLPTSNWATDEDLDDKDLKQEFKP